MKLVTILYDYVAETLYFLSMGHIFLFLLACVTSVDWCFVMPLYDWHKTVLFDWNLDIRGLDIVRNKDCSDFLKDGWLLWRPQYLFLPTRLVRYECSTTGIRNWHISTKVDGRTCSMCSCSLHVCHWKDSFYALTLLRGEPVCLT